MRRREFIAAARRRGRRRPLAARAQQQAMPVIGFARHWAALDPADSLPPVDAFRQGLRDLGYVEGRNVVIEYRDAEGKPSGSPLSRPNWLRSRLMSSCAGGTLAALAAKQATKTLPIVFAAAGDPVASGLVTSLARPGGNVTGLSTSPGASRQVSGTAQAGRSGGQSGRCPLAARCHARRTAERTC